MASDTAAIVHFCWRVHHRIVERHAIVVVTPEVRVGQLASALIVAEDRGVQVVSVPSPVRVAPVEIEDGFVQTCWNIEKLNVHLDALSCR